MILTGEAYNTVCLDPVKKIVFDKIFFNSKVVVASRMSPKQKALLLLDYKNKHPNNIVMAVGDGANDVNMINCADVGIGISGKEGLQAARVSDFAIGEFQILRKLLYCYGIEN